MRFPKRPLPLSPRSTTMKNYLNQARIKSIKTTRDGVPCTMLRCELLAGGDVVYVRYKYEDPQEHHYTQIKRLIRNTMVSQSKRCSNLSTNFSHYQLSDLCVYTKEGMAYLLENGRTLPSDPDIWGEEYFSERPIEEPLSPSPDATTQYYAVVSYYKEQDQDLARCVIYKGGVKVHGYYNVSSNDTHFTEPMLVRKTILSYIEISRVFDKPVQYLLLTTHVVQFVDGVTIHLLIASNRAEYDHKAVLQHPMQGTPTKPGDVALLPDAYNAAPCTAAIGATDTITVSRSVALNSINLHFWSVWERSDATQVSPRMRAACAALCHAMDDYQIPCSERSEVCWHVLELLGSMKEHSMGYKDQERCWKYHQHLHARPIAVRRLATLNMLIGLDKDMSANTVQWKASEYDSPTPATDLDPLQRVIYYLLKGATLGASCPHCYALEAACDPTK